MAQLEFLHRGGHGGIIGVPGLGVCRQVVADDQALAQQRNFRPARARRKLGVGRQGRPAAAHLDGGIAQQRLLDAQISAVVEDGIGAQGERRRRTRFRRRGDCRRELGRRLGGLRGGFWRRAGLGGHGLRRSRLAGCLSQNRPRHDRENSARDNNGPHQIAPSRPERKCPKQLPNRFCLILCRFRDRSGSETDCATLLRGCYHAGAMHKCVR